jgi:hypothetical protein
MTSEVKAHLGDAPKCPPLAVLPQAADCAFALQAGMSHPVLNVSPLRGDREGPDMNARLTAEPCDNQEPTR